MEMTDRKKQILKIVVEEYVAAAEPVGSKAIAQRMPCLLYTSDAADD